MARAPAPDPLMAQLDALLSVEPRLVSPYADTRAALASRLAGLAALLASGPVREDAT